MDGGSDLEILATPNTCKRKRSAKIPVVLLSSSDEGQCQTPKRRKKLKFGSSDKDSLQKRQTEEQQSQNCSSAKSTTNEETVDGVEYVADLTHVNRGWKTEDVVAKSCDVESRLAKIVIELIDHNCTIPFIARYRKKETNNMDVKKLLHVAEEYQNVKIVEKKAKATISNLAKQKKLTSHIHNALMNARNSDEIEYLAAPFKTGTCRSLANKARSHGLGEAAEAVLFGKKIIYETNPYQYIKSVPELKTISDVLDGYKFIISDIMAKDTDVLDLVGKLSKHNSISIHVEEVKKKNKTAEASSSETRKRKNSHERNNSEKFEFYYNFRSTVDKIKPHQVMAINRGEKQKMLKVNIHEGSYVSSTINKFCSSKWYLHQKWKDERTFNFLETCLSSSYKRFIHPHMIRMIRTSLTKISQEECINVFMTNLNNLLLTSPLRGQVVASIDPGFKNGCKLAVTGANGQIINTGIIYPHSHNPQLKAKAASILKEFITSSRCEIIAIGNGVACRETEAFVSRLINNHFFRPLDVKYLIVNEDGVSVYSICDVACKEMPDLEPNIRSAVSLCRRIQDPLLEFIKVDPKHLGVGMYQHDLPQKQLEAALDNVVIKCVSFVGVDLNVCSELLLKKVAGLNSGTAKSIIEHRNKIGYFSNRDELKSIKGVGKKTYEQCAGFIKVLPSTVEEMLVNNRISESNNFNPLDRTCIHPESYPTVLKFLKMINCVMSDIGTIKLTNIIDDFLKVTKIEDIVTHLETDIYTATNIIDNLKKPDHDIRSNFRKPLFRTGIMHLSDLEIGISMTGQVRNVTNFGAFVDIGVGVDGLLHTSKIPDWIKRMDKPQIGDKIEVTVISKTNCKLGLNFRRMLPN
ncbi:SRBD1 (predicted) [Pycnogonum litorale]